MSDVKAVVEVRWLLAAFPEAEMRNDVIYFNGSAFPVTTLEHALGGEDDDPWYVVNGWADEIE